MVDITIPLQIGDDITISSGDILAITPAGGLTLITMKDRHTYRSTAPYELVEIAIASGGGVVGAAKGGS